MEYDEFHDEVGSSESESNGSAFQSSPAIPEVFKQELSDLVRDQTCLKKQQKFWHPNLKTTTAKWNRTSITLYRTRENELIPHFCQQELVQCKNIEGLLKTGVPQCGVEEWRLFIDISKRSWKCILLHNGNRYASLPTGHSSKLREMYNNIRTVLQKLDYEQAYHTVLISKICLYFPALRLRKY